VKVEVGLRFEITFLTQYLGLSIFYPNLGSNNPALFNALLLTFLFIKSWKITKNMKQHNFFQYC